MSNITVVYKGLQHTFSFDLYRTQLSEFAVEVSRKAGTDPDTVKFAVPGRKLVRCSDTPGLSLQDAGLRSGMRLVLFGSAPGEVAKVRASRDLPGLAGFDHELSVLAARRRQSSKAEAVDLPSGPFTFQSFEAWHTPDLAPPPSEALKLLHKLAADSGIVGVMRKHGWRVGKLSEMPPEGKVGVSPVCILGVNINAGQEISLRLRTDDLQGFRRYLSIRQTLCHELAHMVHGEHDLDFKRLNSQLCRECEEMSATGGSRLFQAAEGWELEVPPGPQDVMAATGASSGKTLRELAGTAPLPRPFVAGGRSEAELLGVASLGHRDASTEARERSAEQLGRLPTDQQLGAASSAQASEVPVGAATSMREVEAAQSLAVDDGQVLAPPSHAKQPTELDEAEQPEMPRSEGATSDSATLEAAVPAERVTDASDQYYQDAWSAAQKLSRGLGVQEATAALTTLATILKNALTHPGDAKFTRIRQHNPAFFQRAGRHPEALELLRSAGFVPEAEGQEQVLRLQRKDPGLLWICHLACENALTYLGPDSAARGAAQGASPVEPA